MHKRLFAALLALFTMLAMLPGTALAASYMGGTTLPDGTAFTVNGRTVSKASGSSLNNCSIYASQILSIIWQVNETMTTYSGEYNMLKDMNADERTVTIEHTKSFIQAAPLGSRIRVCYDSGTAANNKDNNRLGHTMVLVDRDDAAGTFTVLHAGWGGSAATEYTYSGFVDYNTGKKNPYNYFFYIANYSAADPSSIENIPAANIPTDTSLAARTWNGHTYKLFDESLSWSDAKARCESMGGYLACINSSTEQSVIANLIQNGRKEFYWLGGSDADSEGVWKWVTGEAWSYSNWGSGQPGSGCSGGEDYLGISRVSKPLVSPGEWNDCNNQGSSTPLGGFICEIGPAAPTTCTITLNANGGKAPPSSLKVESGKTYLPPLPTPYRPGYHFKGWYTKKTGGTKVTETTRVNLTANQTLYAQWQTAAVTAKSIEKKAFTITVPAYYELALYSTATGAKVADTVETTGYQDIRCTQKATLSNGTARYCGKVNNKNYWFTYSCEMDVR